MALATQCPHLSHFAIGGRGERPSKINKSMPEKIFAEWATLLFSGSCLRGLLVNTYSPSLTFRKTGGTPYAAWVYSEEDFSPRSYSQSLLRKKVDEGVLLKVGEVDVRLLFRILVKYLKPCTIEDSLQPDEALCLLLHPFDDDGAVLAG